jgi:hypothetical protein
MVADLKAKLKACRAELRELRNRQAIASAVDSLIPPKPDEKLERQYGPIYTWSSPLLEFLKRHEDDRVGDV